MEERMSKRKDLLRMWLGIQGRAVFENVKSTLGGEMASVDLAREMQ